MYKSKRPDRGDRGGNSPVSKRSRSSLGRYNDVDSDDDKGGRGGRSRSPLTGSRSGRDRERDYYESSSRSSGYKDGGHHAPSSGSIRPYQYKVLCISALHARASDEAVRDTLYREFKRFGDISVKVVHEPDERVAYVYFRSYEDAKEAKSMKSRIIIFDKPVMIEAAYESSSSSSSNNNNTNTSNNYRPHDSYDGGSRGSGGYGGGGGGGDRGGGSSYNRRSPHLQPPPNSYDRGHRDDHRGGGGGGGYDRYHGGHGGPPAPAHSGPPPPHYNMTRHDDYRRGSDPRDFGGSGGSSRGHHQPMYPPRYDNYNSNSNRYPPGPPPPSHGPPMRGPPMPPPSDRAPYENKKDKFPNYLHHIAPEDDPLATRTLFAGNLEVNIPDEELRRIFGRYGTVEDIDIKRPPPGTGNAFAFVRFANLDMAAKAKTELSGQYIGKFQCKIGYGKVNPTTKIWVGGLGPWATLSQIEREFDRFGSIKKIDWDKGDHQCFITYETIDAAQAAVKDMRGYALGGNDKRIRTDFAGVEQVVGYAGKYEDKSYDYGSGGSSGGGSRKRPTSSSSNVVISAGGGDEEAPAANYSPHSTDNAESQSDSESNVERRKPDATAGRNGTATSAASAMTLSSAKSVVDISRKQTVGWQGTLILKNSVFPTKLYLTEGDLQNVNVLLKDEEGKDKLRITQRLRLDQAKLEDVTKRMEASSGYGVFLGWPASANSPLSSPNAGSESPVQSRPLKNLVSYLKQKEAAGVINLLNKAIDLTGVLYAFPPCAFSLELLQKTFPGLEETKDDYLVVVVIRGGTA